MTQGQFWNYLNFVEVGGTYRRTDQNTLMRDYIPGSTWFGLAWKSGPVLIEVMVYNGIASQVDMYSGLEAIEEFERRVGRRYSEEMGLQLLLEV